MKIGIMQPYFLPYVGYWQLIAAVDKFVVLDDVNYINRGWINRNQVAINGKPSWVTLPLQGASQNKLIYELDLVSGSEWRCRILKTIRHAYKKAPNFEFAYSIFDNLIQRAEGNLSSFLVETIVRICFVLGVKTEIIPTSRSFPKNSLKGSNRIIDICRQLGATDYINPYGGKELYEEQAFITSGFSLYFLSPQLHSLDLCLGSPESPSLSILDLLMYNTIDALAVCIKSRFKIETKTS